MVERGTEVTLQVSRGPEQVAVPDLVGESEDDARSALEEVGLRAGEVTEEENADEEPGTVLEQDPAAGDEVDRGAPSTSWSPPRRPTSRCPEVLGLSEDEAVTAIEEAGFEVRLRDQITTDATQEGLVLDQAPDPGEERPEGSTIRIAIGRVGEATATPSPTTEP